jgi:hypothetical protein
MIAVLAEVQEVNEKFIDVGEVGDLAAESYL